MALSIGTLVGYLKLDDQAYAAALEKNAARTKRFAGQASDAFSRMIGPAAIATGITLFTRTAVQLASQIKDAAEQAGVGIEEYQALDYVFRQNGSSGEDLVATLAKLRGAVADAANGSKPARENLARLGLHFSELIKLSPAEMLVKIAQKMRDAGTNTATFAAAADLLGSRNLPKLNEGLRELADKGVEGALKTAQALNQIVSAERIRLVDDFSDSLSNLGREAKNMAVNGLGALLEVVKDPAFEKSFRGLQWVPRALPPGGNEQQRRARAAAEMAEERRMMRADAAANEARQRTAETIARVNDRYGSAPAAGRSGAISASLLDKAEARQRSDALRAQRDALDDQLELVRKEQELFQRGLTFTAANDPFIALSESIREANETLESGVVTAVAYTKAINDAATAFGAAKLQQVQDQGALAGLGGQRGKASTFTRTEAYARRLAAQGKYEEAANQINYLKSLDPALGTQLETAMGLGAVGPATAQANATQRKARGLEDRVDKLTLALEDIAKKLTVS